MHLTQKANYLLGFLWRKLLPKSPGRSYYDSLLPPPDLSREGGIPRKIHQTSYSKKLPQEIQDNIAYLQELNPGWSYSFYDDADIEAYLNRHYPEEILNYFRKISPGYGAAKADLFRYLLIYQEGGVYLDIKSTLTEPLENHLRSDDELVLSYWDNLPCGQQEGLWINHKEYPNIPRGELMQWIIISKPRHPMIREVIIQVLKNLDCYCPFTEIGGEGEGLWGTLRTTGPIAYTHSLVHSMPLYAGHFRIVNLYRDWGVLYSIYSEPGEFGHKKILRTDYRLSYNPIVAHPVKWVQWLATSFLKMLQGYQNIRLKFR